VTGEAREVEELAGADGAAEGSGHGGWLAVVRAVWFSAVPRVLEGVDVSDVDAGLEMVVVELVRGVWGPPNKASEGKVDWVRSARENAVEVFDGGLRSHSWSGPSLGHLA
jgi:hypothetical protein